MSFPDRRQLLHMNWGVIITALLLFVVGLVNLYSASSVRSEDGMVLAPFYQRQIIWGLIGFVGMLVCLLVNYQLFERLAWPTYIIVLIMLCLVPVAGKMVYGARRWLDLGFFSLQPGELAKIAVLILGARVLAKDSKTLGWLRLGKVLLIGLIPFVLIVRQPDLGTALSVMVVLGGMVMFHGVKWQVVSTCIIVALAVADVFLILTLFEMPLSVLLVLLVVAVSIVLLLYGGKWRLTSVLIVTLVAAVHLVLFASLFDRVESVPFLHDYQLERIKTFIDPTRDPLGAGYHTIQAQIAIGSGEMFGKGYFAGTQSQLRFLPEKHTDFAIAVLGEERGFVGCFGLIILFCLFLASIYNTVRDSKDRFESTLVAGVFFYFFWQIIVNMGMVIGLMPVVGIPLPFISYGGSAMVVNCALLGLVLNVSIRRFVFKG